MTAAYVRFAGAHATHDAVMIAMLPNRGEGPGAAALQAAAKTTFATLAGAISAASPDLTHHQAHRRALHAWAHAHVAVSVGGLATGLDASFDPDAFAVEVGEAVRARGPHSALIPGRRARVVPRCAKRTVPAPYGPQGAATSFSASTRSLVHPCGSSQNVRYALYHAAFLVFQIGNL